MFSFDHRQIKFGFCVFWLVALLGLMGCSMFAVSSGFSDQRGQNIDYYYEAIEDWEQNYRSAFSSIKISVFEGSWNRNKTEVFLNAQDKDPNLLEKDEYGILKTYEPLFYELSFPASNINLDEFSEFNTDLLIQLNLYITSKNSEEAPSEVNIPQLQIFKYQEETNGFLSACEDLEGYYDFDLGKCISLWVWYT